MEIRGAGLLRRDQPVGGHRRSFSAAKKAAARLSRSRSCFRRAFSLAQRAQLLELGAGRHIGALAAVSLVLAAPVAQRLLGHAEALGELARGAAGTQHLHRLAAELRRVRGSGLGHVGHHPCAPSGRESSDVRKTGGTPACPCRLPSRPRDEDLTRLLKAMDHPALDQQDERDVRASVIGTRTPGAPHVRPTRSWTRSTTIRAGRRFSALGVDWRGGGSEGLERRRPEGTRSNGNRSGEKKRKSKATANGKGKGERRRRGEKKR